MMICHLKYSSLLDISRSARSVLFKWLRHVVDALLGVVKLELADGGNDEQQWGDVEQHFDLPFLNVYLEDKYKDVWRNSNKIEHCLLVTYRKV